MVDLATGLLNTVTRFGLNMAENTMFAEGMKYLQQYTNRGNDFDALVTVKIQKRELDGKIGMQVGDHETVSLQVKIGETVTSHPGFEIISVAEVVLKPSAGISIDLSRRWFVRESHIYNGTNRTKRVRWNFYDQPFLAFNIIKVPMTGVLEKERHLATDGRLWTHIFTGLLILLIVCLVIKAVVSGKFKSGKTESYFYDDYS